MFFLPLLIKLKLKKKKRTCLISEVTLFDYHSMYCVSRCHISVLCCLCIKSFQVFNLLDLNLDFCCCPSGECNNIFVILRPLSAADIITK